MRWAGIGCVRFRCFRRHIGGRIVGCDIFEKGRRLFCGDAFDGINAGELSGRGLKMHRRGFCRNLGRLAKDFLDMVHWLTFVND